MKSNIQTVFTIIAITIGFSLVVSSCSKKSESPAPIITLASPTDNALIAVGDTFDIEGTLSDDEGLHEASILMIRSTGDTVFQQYPYVHDVKAYPFKYLYFTPLAGSYKIKIVAEDHEERRTEKSVNITIN